MSRAEALTLHASAILVGSTGLVYGWMRYCLEPPDEFSVVNHPQQPLLQHLHVLLAPLLVFACGVVWSDHVWKRIRTRHPERRRTGLALFAALPPMIASGYAVQVAESEFARALSIGVHATSSCAFLLAYALHQLAGVRARSEQAQPRRGERGPALESTVSSSRSA